VFTPTRTQRSHNYIGLILASSLFVAPAVQAQHRTGPEKAAAESLFDQAMQHLKDGNLPAACEHFERSQKIDPAVGTLLYLAECYERTGKTASAWATFREAASLARELRESDRAAIGDQRAAKLESQLSKVTVLTSNVQSIPNLTLTQDGVPLNPALFGASVPIDPGSHTLIAEAPGYEPLKLDFEIAADTATTTVDVPALVAKPVAELPPAPPKHETIAPQASPVVQPATTPTSPADHTVSFILGGAGLVFVGVGVGFGVHAKGLDDRAAKDCERSRCATTHAETLSDDAQQAALLSNIGYGVGAAAIVTGALLFMLDTNKEDSDKLAAFHLAPALSGGQLWYEGTF
jgi:hypothetical protein